MRSVLTGLMLALVVGSGASASAATPAADCPGGGQAVRVMRQGSTELTAWLHPAVWNSYVSAPLRVAFERRPPGRLILTAATAAEECRGGSWQPIAGFAQNRSVLVGRRQPTAVPYRRLAARLGDRLYAGRPVRFRVNFSIRSGQRLRFLGELAVPLQLSPLD